MDKNSIGLCLQGFESLRCLALHSNHLLISSENPGFDGTAAHGPAVLSVEKKLRRIMLCVGFQKQNLEKPFRTKPNTTPKTNSFAKWVLRLRLPRFLLLRLSGYVINSSKATQYSLWGSSSRPMAHKTIALTTELREHSCSTCKILLARVEPACA